MTTAGQKTKIMILDDDSDICLFSKELLSRRGYDVVTACSSAEAIETLRRERPSMALLDVHLSGGQGGLDVLRFARENDSQCLCMMVTKEDRASVMDEARELGAVAYLTKPVTVKDLETAVLQAAEKVRREMSQNG